MKKLARCETEIKIVYQDLVKALSSCEEKPGTRKSSLEIDTTNPSVLPDSHQQEQVDLSMTDHVALTKTLLNDVFGSHLASLTESVNSIFELKYGPDCSANGQQLIHTTALLVQLISCLEGVIERQMQVVQSMSKFSYLTQRVFLYLIYQGFCGVEEPDDPEEEPPADLEEGMGLGDGGGGN